MSSQGRIKDIEVLRGYAVILVCLQHLNGVLYRFPKDGVVGNLYNWFQGAAGVDLFFAISGFVIARSVLPAFSGGLTREQFKNAAFNFWVRRVFRLLPSAWLWLGIILLLSIVYNQSGAFSSVKANIEATVAGVLQIANFRFAHAFGQYQLGGSFHYWSLSLEEQFYFLFPFLAVLNRKLLVLVLVGVVGYQLFLPRDFNVWYQAFRTDAICLGVLLAIMANTKLFASFKCFCERYKWALSIAAIFFIAMVAYSASKNAGFFPYTRSYVAIASFFVVMIASFDFDVVSRITPLHKTVLWIGTRSYAIYLLHVPVYHSVRETYFRLDLKMGDSVWVAVLVSSFLIAILAHLNFKYAETPLRRKGAALSERKFGGSAGWKNTSVVGTQS